MLAVDTLNQTPPNHTVSFVRETKKVPSSRLSLASLNHSDVQAFYDLFNDYDATRMTHALSYPLCKQEMDEFFERILSQTHWGVWFDQKLVGCVHLKDNACGKKLKRAFGPHISITISKHYRGQGIGREALSRIIDQLSKRRDFSALYAACFVDNIASQNLLTAVDFLATGRLTYETSKARSEPSLVRHFVRLF